MSETYKYKAFISYRHQPLDSAAAERLQKLLEKYKAPRKLGLGKQKMRIFRDVSELPSSESLGEDIRSALRQSEFLIVVCSPEYRFSKWCMEELRYFRSLHGNTNKNIIPLLVSGQPAESFPEEICWNEVHAVDSNGEPVTTRVEVEPLAANITAPTAHKSMKKLDSEYLRIVAPLLGVGYDDLYRREFRRKRARRAAAVAGAMGVLSVITVISAVSAVAIRKKNDLIAEKNGQLLKENAVHLAQESEIMYRNGDLLSAIECAYSAMPQGDDGNPVVPDIENILSKELKLYETKNIMPQIALTHDTAIESLQYTGAGKTITSSDSTGIYFWDAETGELLKKITPDDDGFESDKQLRLYYERVQGADNAPFVSQSAPDLGADFARNSTFDTLFTNLERDLSVDVPGEGSDVFVVNESDFTITRLDGVTGKTEWVSEPGELSYISVFYDDGFMTRFGSIEENGKTKYYVEPIMLDSGISAGTYEITSAIKELWNADLCSLKMSINKYGYLTIIDEEHYRYYLYSIFDESGELTEEDSTSGSPPSSISLSQRTFGTDFLIAMTFDYLYYQNTDLMLFTVSDNGSRDAQYAHVSAMNIGPDPLIEMYPGDELGLSYDLLVLSDDRSVYVYRYDKLEEIVSYRFEADISSASLSEDGFIHVLLSDGNDYRVRLEDAYADTPKIGMHFGKAQLSNGSAVYSQGRYVTYEKYSNVAYIQYERRNEHASEELSVDGECNYLIWAVNDDKIVYSTYTGDSLIQQWERDDHVWLYDGSDGSVREIEELEDCYVYNAVFLDSDTLLVHFRRETDNTDSMFIIDTGTLDCDMVISSNDEAPMSREKIKVSGGIAYYTSQRNYLLSVDRKGKIKYLTSDEYGDEIFLDFAAAPSSGCVIGSAAAQIDSDPLYKVYMYDPEEGLSELMDCEEDDVINCFWLDDDTPCFLGRNRTIYVFDNVKNGKYTKISLDGITADPIAACVLTDRTMGVLCRDNCLYEVDLKGYTGRSVELTCDAFDENGQISAYDSCSAFMLESRPVKRTDMNAVVITWDICSPSESVFRSYMDNAWVLLPDEMKVLYYIPYYVGAADDLSTIYTNDYTSDTICSYPLYSAEDIIAAAQEYLAALK